MLVKFHIGREHPLTTEVPSRKLKLKVLAAHPKHRLEQREEESREAQARRRRKRVIRRAVATV